MEWAGDQDRERSSYNNVSNKTKVKKIKSQKVLIRKKKKNHKRIE